MPSARPSKKTYEFFISRNKADADWAVWIAWQLEQAGYSVVVQDWDFGSGNNFVLKMHDAVENSRRTIAVLSTDFLKSEYTAPEWAAAFAEDPTGRNQKLVPIKVRRCSPKGLLAQINWIDLVGLGEEDARTKLLTEIKPGRRKPTSPPDFPGKIMKRKPTFPGPEKAKSNGGSRSGNTASSDTASSSITAKVAAEKVAGLKWGAPIERRNRWSASPTLGVLLTPGHQHTPYIDELDLGNSQLQNSLQLLALKGVNSVLRSDLGTQIREELGHLTFVQTERGTGSYESELEMYTDGTLIHRVTLVTPERMPDYSIADGLIIDETQVHTVLTSFLRFANSFYSQRRRDPGKVYVGASLAGIQTKFFGRMPTTRLSSFSIPDHRLEDPLHVPTAPLALSADERRAPDAVAKKLVDHFGRRFRIQGAYYRPTNER